MNLFFSAGDGFEIYKPDTRAQIYPNGTVVWFVPVIFTASCKMRVTWFPFDTQVCDLKFLSWGYDGLAIDLHPEQSADASWNRFVNLKVWHGGFIFFIFFLFIYFLFIYLFLEFDIYSSFLLQV